MTKGFLRLPTVVLALSLVVTACSSSASDDSTTTAATGTAAAPATTTSTARAVSCDEPVKVGVITDQSGPLELYGEHIMSAFPLGMEYATGTAGTDSYMLDGCEIQVLYRDDQTNVETSVALARELIEVEGVDILVGSVSSGVTADIQQLAMDNDVIHIAAPAAANDLTGSSFNPNSFRVSRNNYQDGVSICEYLPTVYSTFVQIAPDYSFGYGGAQAYRDACTLNGGTFVTDDIFASADTQDFTPYMEQILDSGAEAWLVTWAGSGFVPMLQAATDVGVMDKMALASPFVDNVVMPIFFAQAIGTTSSILYHYTQPNNEINDWLISKAAEAGTFPDLFWADGMNAALLVTEALKATGGNANAAALRDAMEGLKFEGPKGMIQIRAEDHVAIQDMYVVTLTNLDDSEFKYFEAVETNRPAVPCLLEGEYADRCGDVPAGSLGG